MIKCLIIGGGPAGYTAAIYAGRAGLEPVVLEGPEPGGQLTSTSTVSNYPGFANGIDASALMEQMRSQAIACGADVRTATVVSSDLKNKTVTLSEGTSLRAGAILIATGASAKYLGLPSEQKYRGMGVSACAVCDGFLCRRKVVAVVGGGDAACEEASYLSEICSKVYMIVRKDYLRASVANKTRVESIPNIEILYNTTTREVLGDANGVTAVRVDQNGEIRDIDIFGFFLAIGRHPNTEPFSDQLIYDDQGYIVSDGVKTGLDGIFVAGDVRNTDYRQAVTAAADGCRAALEIEKYLKK